jgi:hypothetical protein
VTAALDLLSGAAQPPITPVASAPQPQPAPSPPVTPPPVAAGPAALNNLGGLSLNVKTDGSPNLFHQTRPIQWSTPNPVTEPQLWGTTDAKASAPLSVPADPEQGWKWIAAKVAGDRATDGTVAVLQALGQRLSTIVPTHAGAPNVYRLPEQAPMAATAFEISRWQYAVDHGLLQGDKLNQAATVWGRVQAGEKINAGQAATLFDGISKFAQGVQFAEHPELAIHPLVGVNSVNADDGGRPATNVNVLSFDQSTPAKLSSDELQQRLAQSVALHPSALVDHMRANIVDILRRNKTGSKVDPFNVAAGAAGFPVEPGTIPDATLDRAVDLASLETGLPADQVKRVVSAHPTPNDRIPQVLSGTPQPVDWGSLTSPVTKQVAVKELNRQPPPSAETTVKLNGDGTTSVLAGSGVAPEKMRGLAPTPLLDGGQRVMTPVAPAGVPALPSTAAKLSDDGENSLPWKKPGFWLLTMPPTEIRDSDGRLVRTGDQSNNSLIAEMRQNGVHPVDSQPLHPMMDGQTPRAPLMLRFHSADDLQAAHRTITPALLPEDASSATTAPVVAYVNGPGEAPAGLQRVTEQHFRDAAGNYGIAWSKQHPISGNTVAAYTDPSSPLTRDNRLSLWDASPGARPVTSVVLGLSQSAPPKIALGTTDPTTVQGDPSQTVIVRHDRGRAVISLPETDGKVSAQTAHAAVTAVRALGVTDPVTFRGYVV